MVEIPGRTNDQEDWAASLSQFQRATDEVPAIPRPDNIGSFYLEDEYDAAEKMQPVSHAEAGEVEARDSDVKAARLEHQATVYRTLSQAALQDSEAARERHVVATEALGPLARRTPAAKKIYALRLLALVLADMAGVSGAVILGGGDYVHAGVLALGAGMSVVTLGGAGRQLRYRQDERRRALPAEPTEAQNAYLSYYTPGGGVDRLTKLVILVCAAGLAFLALAIFLLRLFTTEDMSLALAFGGLAVAFGMASFYASYDVADEAAEALDRTAKEARVSSENARKLASAAPIQEHAAAQAVSLSIRTQHVMSGVAAAFNVRVLKYGALGRSSVAGVGRRQPPQALPVVPPAPRSAAPTSEPRSNGKNPASESA